MSNKSNVSLIALGINEHRAGTAQAEGGIAHIAEGIATGWFSPLRWSYGSGDDEQSGVFNLGDFYKPVMKPNGEEDIKAKSAKFLALAENYGIDGELTTADKVAFQRGFTIAAAMNTGVPVKFASAKVKRAGKATHVRAAVVPAAVAFKLTDKEGKPSEIANAAMEAQKSNLRLFGQDVPEDEKLFAMVAALPVECVGGKHPVFGKVPSASALASALRPIVSEAGLMPTPKPRNSNPKGEAFSSSADFIVKSIDLLLSDKGESDFAPSNALNDKLRAVAERIAAYFASGLAEVEPEPQGEITF